MNIAEQLRQHDLWLTSKRKSGALLEISDEKIEIFDVRGARFQKAVMTNCDFQGASFHSCIFTDADLESSRFDNCTFHDCSFIKANLRHTSFCNARLYNCDFSQADLTFTKLFDAQAEGAIFRAASLRGAMCNLTNFQRANFAEAVLMEATLADCDLRNCQFLYSVVVGTIFRGSKIGGARFDPLITLLLADWGECSPETTNAVRRFNEVQLRGNQMTPFVNIQGGTDPPEHSSGPMPTAWDILCMILTEHCEGWAHPHEHPEDDPKSRAEVLKDRELV